MSSYHHIHSKVLRDSEEDYFARMKIDRLIFILLLISIALVPLVVGGYASYVASPKVTDINLVSSGIKGDLFSHYKSILLMLLAGVSFLLLLIKIIFIDGVLRKTPINLFLTVFLIALIISTLISPTTSIATWGSFERSDGMLSYLSYIILFFVAINIEYPKKKLSYIMAVLYPFVFINLFLIVMNFIGKDIFQYEVPRKLASLFLDESSAITESSIIVGTLNQWNYMSGMFAVMTVMYLAWAIIDKNQVRSIINALVAVVSFAIMLMSISTSGFVTVLAITPLLIILAIKSNRVKQAVVVFSVFVIVTLPIFHVLAKEDPRVWNESIGFVIKKNPYAKEQTAANVGEPHKFSLERRAYAADNQFELPVLPERGTAAGSGRAYIWEKTLKLTMERPLFGYGMDTLLYNFPHYSIDARAGMWSETVIVDKPHNMYIGVLYGTGIIGFFGFMGIIVMTGLGSFKILLTNRLMPIAVLAIGWLAFLIQALFNDSLPGTAGPMWAIAGIMMAFVLGTRNVEESSDGRND